MKSEHLYEITIYTENQVGLLSSIAGIFTRRSLSVEKLLVYPSRREGVHKLKITTRTTEDKVKAVVLQIEKKVDVIKSYYYLDDEHSDMELLAVKEFLAEREKEKSEI